MNTVNALSPDLIVMTGDYVTETYDSAAVDLVPMLRLLKATDGVMGVMGNHDYWGRAGVGVIRSALAESNVIDMNNKVHALEREGSTLHIAGLDRARGAEQIGQSATRPARRGSGRPDGSRA